MNAKNIPTVFVIFGATGDLMGRKVVPSLYHLYIKNKLPKLFRIIGVSRRQISNDEFKNNIIDILKNHYDDLYDEEKIQGFLNYFFYHQGDFTNRESYTGLAGTLGHIDGEWKACSNKLFFLAVPPQYYETILNHLHNSGSTSPCSSEEGWTRVLLEKPFGKNADTAESLDLLLGKLFKEEQIYRIDHYLAKEMLQNILSFRFSNTMFEQSWNNKFIDQIEIKFFEKVGIGSRGGFYDGIGALRDVGQNHMLQMLALVTMNHPCSYKTDEIRRERTEIFKSLRIHTTEEVQKYTFRGQYEGYRDMKSVDARSNTETYFKIHTEIQSSRWQGVPIILESGKSMREDRVEIVVTYKPEKSYIFPPVEGMPIRNKIIIQLVPNEEIKILFVSKKPGSLQMEVEERDFNFSYRNSDDKTQYVEEYEKLFIDAIEGNQLLFASTDEIKYTWKFIDPIISAWDDNIVPLKIYTPHTGHIFQLANEHFATRSPLVPVMNKEVLVVGLGKMGGNIARNLLQQNWTVFGYNRTSEVTKQFETEGLQGIYDLKNSLKRLSSPRVVWLMLTAGKAIDEILFGESGLVHELKKGDIIIEAGNSYFKETMERAKKIRSAGLRFIDVGVSGGPGGARNGACLMVGGKQEDFDYLLPVFTAVTLPNAVQFFPGDGAGHFVKMVHNGIEYGMMQAIGEGFHVMKESAYDLDLSHVTEIYNNGSVIESRLVRWLHNALKIHTNELHGISGKVSSSGEGSWTIKAATELGVKVQVIEDALQFRIDSIENPNYTGQVVSALRNQFGGHAVGEKDYKTVK